MISGVKRLALTLGLAAGLFRGAASSAGAADFLTPDGTSGGLGSSSPTNTWCETLETTCLADLN